jgi:hypothetical protein
MIPPIIMLSSISGKAETVAKMCSSIQLLVNDFANREGEYFMPHVHCDCVLFNDTVNYGDEEQV